MLYTLETVLHTAFATQPILTVASLEAAILKMPAFKQITAFKDANLGDLQKHPELLRRLRLNDPSMPALPVPKSFPSISHEEIITGILDSLPRKFWDWNAEDAWTLEKGLKYIAEQRGLNDSRLLGIFVQQEFLFRTIISVYKQREVGKGKGHGKGSLEMNLEGSLNGCVLTCSFVFTFLCGAQMSSAVLLRVETWNRPGEMSAAVSKALRQVEKVQQKQVQSQLITSCDWMLWEKMLSSFGKLETGERLEFVQELSVRSFANEQLDVSFKYHSDVLSYPLHWYCFTMFYCYIIYTNKFCGKLEIARKFFIANDDQSWSGRFKKQTTQTMPCDDAWALCFWPASPWPPAKNCRRQQLLQIKHILVMQ